MARLVMGRLPLRPSEESTLSRMTDPWWEICTSCWRYEPSSRPSAKELMEKVKGPTVCARGFSSISLHPDRVCSTKPVLP
ncbi:hypothetical protein EDC04DRAFT_2642864 [Pisolithus marmoratus]|nr:hypothetical protein EDC04DRAFT_2642864 [Pisolithus marmoratus]